MKIINPSLLAEYRTHGRCEWCGKNCRIREPHHLWATGMGGGARLDIPINLVSLGSTQQWQCDCHRAIHDGNILRIDLLAVVAVRENVNQDDIRAVINLLRRLDDDAPAWEIERQLQDVWELDGPGAVLLAMKTLKAHLEAA